MLFDPKWEQKAKADPTLENLIAWLEKQPARIAYDGLKPQVCLLGQFLTAMGVPDDELMFASFNLGYETKFGDIAYKHQPWTFGAALERARALG